MNYIGSMKKFIGALLLIISIGHIAAANGSSDKLFPSFSFDRLRPSVTQSNDEISVAMQKLELLYRLVDRDFLFDIDYDAVYESMAKGLFTGLKDEYSAYIVSQEASDFSEETSGRYGGIGAYISKHYLEYRDFSKPETYMVNITSVFPGSPAENAGLKAGDLVSHIDGEPVDDWEAAEASKNLKGEANTPVILTIVRGSSTFDVTVIRKIVNVPTVSIDHLDNGIAYLRITQFTNSTAKQVYDELKQFVDEGMSALVLDLRDNPGGVVDATLSVADMFLSDAPIVNINSKNDVQDHIYRASKGTLVPSNLPIAVLVNKGSASASEILSGALKDNHRATLIGSTTYGKGLIQVVSPFGDGYYTLTTSQYKTPNGNDIHKVGIPVDIEVEEPHIDEEHMEEYLLLLNSGVAKEFVEEHPEYSPENVELFIDTNVGSDPPLERDVYRIMIRREYLLAIPFESRPIADPGYDRALQKAIDYLNDVASM